jgi:competence protein ComEA
MKNALYSLFGVLAGFILAGALFFVSRAPAGEPIVLQPAPTEAPIAVYVVGAVARPGVYKFPEGARIQDAIDAAGGLLTTAKADTLNLAALVQDGQQLDIPFREGEGPPVSEPTIELPGGTESPTAVVDTGGGGSEDLLNINTATLEELDALPGIGPATAQKIIDYREENGDFFSVDDLLEVSGIGEQTLEGIRDLIMTGYE